MVAAALPSQPLLLPAPARKPYRSRIQQDFFPLCPDCGTPMKRIYGGKLNGVTVWKYRCHWTDEMWQNGIPHSRLMRRAKAFTEDELIAIAHNRAAFAISERKYQLFWTRENSRLLDFESREAIPLPAPKYEARKYSCCRGEFPTSTEEFLASIGLEGWRKRRAGEDTFILTHGTYGRTKDCNQGSWYWAVYQARKLQRKHDSPKVFPFPATTPKPAPKPVKKPTIKPFIPPPSIKPAASGTELKHALRGHRTAAKSMSHIVLVGGSFARGNLSRKAGDPLCKPLDKFPHGLTNIVPSGDPVCPRCAELAERYDLPMPGNVELTIMPSSRKLGPDDPQVTYDPHSKWFNYNFGFPFNGYLRQWGWLRNHCVCKQCGSPVSTERGSEPVKGMEIFDYYTCTSGHPIKDERDLKRSDRQPKGAGSADEVIKGYPWLKAAVPDDIPF